MAVLYSALFECECVCFFMQYTSGMMVCKVYVFHLLSIADVTSFSLEIAKSFKLY